MDFNFQPQSMDDMAAYLHELFVSLRLAGFGHKQAMFLVAVMIGSGKVDIPDETEQQATEILDRMRGEV